MGKGKLWKVPKEKIQELYRNADSDGNCHIEIWHETSDKVEDYKLYLKLDHGWFDDWPGDEPVAPGKTMAASFRSIQN